MSSKNNRRIRRVRKRHARLVERLKDRARTFEVQGRAEELKIVRTELNAVHPPPLPTTEWGGVKFPPPVRKPLRAQGWVARRPSVTLPPEPQKQDPRVHGVNSQRETRSRPTVGGAGRKRP